MRDNAAPCPFLNLQRTHTMPVDLFANLSSASPFLAAWSAGPVTRATLWRAWHLSPVLCIGLLLWLILYGMGAAQLAQRRTRTPTRGRAIAFGVGWLTLIVALVSPLDALSETLFSAHMIQHLLLMLIAPPLLVISRPLPVLLWALPRPARLQLAGWRGPLAWLRQIWGLLTQPLVALAAYTASLWVWHAPVLYESALRHDAIHALEHACFFGASMLLWWAVLQPKAGQRGYGMSILILLISAIQGSILGVLLTFSNVLWYPSYALFTQGWGMTPLDDQRMAGLIMWIPPGVLYLGAVAALFVAWLAAVERDAQRREQPAAVPGQSQG